MKALSFVNKLLTGFHNSKIFSDTTYLQTSIKCKVNMI